MRKILIAFITVIVCFDCFALPTEVVRIVDGDTFIGRVKLSKTAEVADVSIRLRNVDTPELRGQCEQEIKQARAAKQRLAELIPEGSTIEIKNITNDKYDGRIDANVFDSNNRDVGQILIKEKFGRAYSGGTRRSWCSK